MTRHELTMMLVTTGLLLGLAFVGPPTATAALNAYSVASVKVDGDRLQVTAAREELLFHGSYESAKGERVEFDEGKPLKIVGKDRSKTTIDEIKIEDGKVVFGGDGNDILLDDGRYDLINPKTQGDPEPQPEPEPEPQPRPNPNAFEVRDGEIVTVWM